MKHNRIGQMASVSAICQPSAICRKSNQKPLFLITKYTNNVLNENVCYLPSGIYSRHLDSIKSNNPNKNNSLQTNSRWREVDSVEVLPSGAKPVTTRAAALFSECCAPPIYLRYICKTQRLHLGFTFTDIRYVSGGRGCDR